MHYRPIFIGGCDRSGTTLLGDLLGASREAFATPESQFVHDLAHRMASGAFTDAEAAAAWLLEEFRFAAWGMDVDRTALARLIDLEDPRGTVERLIHAYVARRLPEKASVKAWVDHTPDNFKHYALLKALFPEARFVHIVRDGRAVCHSITGLDWGPNNAYAATRHWSERLRQATTVEVAEAGRCLVVRYEDLVAAPEEVLRELSQALEIAFDPAQVEGGGVILPEFTRAQHRLIGKGPDASRVTAWREKMTPRQIATFEAYGWSRVFLQKYGYPLTTGTPRRESMPQTLGYYLHDFVAYLRNRRRHKRMERRTVLRGTAR